MVVVLWVVVVGVAVALAAVWSLSYVGDQVGPVECKQPSWRFTVVTKSAEVKIDGVVLVLEL